MGEMGDARSRGIQLCKRCLAASPVACHEHQPRPQPRQALGGDLADAGGGSGHHDDFAVKVWIVAVHVSIHEAPLMIEAAAARSLVMVPRQ